MTQKIQITHHFMEDFKRLANWMQVNWLHNFGIADCFHIYRADATEPKADIRKYFWELEAEKKWLIFI